MTIAKRQSDRDLRRACAEHPDDLLESQRKAIELVRSGINLAIRRAAEVGEEPEHNDRPNQVYLIDGGRGSGKTFTLLTAERVISTKILGAKAAPADAKTWARLTDPLRLGPDCRAEVLRIIFPGEFTEGEMLMEHVFAAIGKRLDDAEREFEKGDPSLIEVEKLRGKLLKEVAQGWYFAKRFGLEAVVRDAINYDDLVDNWSRESGNASRRIDRWRAFVTEWLEFAGAKLLIIMLDDSDNDESLTDNILHSLRLVLDHPQIVTVLAGNLTAMRESLIHLRMQRIAPAVGALSDGQSLAAKEWRRKLRREVEEYLEKVIPQQQRVYLTVARPDAAVPAAKDDFEQVVGIPLAQMVEDALHDTREEFLKAKFALALRHEAQETDAASREQQRTLEAFLSWWLFGNLYGTELKPRSVRNLHTIREYYEEKPQAKEAKERWKKRLPVALYGMSANFDLLQRLTDDDPAIIPWLRHQLLRSEWSQRRAFVINNRWLPRRDYGHAFLRYQLDIGLAMPFRDNADQMVPGELLPIPIGRRHLRRFFQPRQSPRRHRRLGLARWLDHAAIPSNCLYFYDLMALPDGAFIDVEQLPEASRRREVEELQAGRWESRLADEWLSTVEDDQETDADEYLARYFREIVCETLRGTEIIPSGELLNLMDPPDIIQKQTKAIYEHFVADELKSFGMHFTERATKFRDLLRDLFGQRGTRTRSHGFVRHQIKNPVRMIALYTSLASDLRRGWHAIRIHKVAPRVLGPIQGESTAQEVHAIVATKDRLRLYKSASIRGELIVDPWVKRMLEGLEKAELESSFDNYFQNFAREDIKIRRNIEFLRQFAEEMATRIGRARRGSANELSLLQTLVKAFHHSEFEFEAFDAPIPAGFAEQILDEQIDQSVADERDAWRSWALGLETNLAGKMDRLKELEEKGRDRPAEDKEWQGLENLAIAQARFRLYLRKVDISRLFEAMDSLAKTPQVQEESESFDVWMWTLRNVARFLCDDWPFHDSMLSPTPAKLHHPPLATLLEITEKVSTPADEAKQQQQRDDARSARNFSLLLYGLAPSLPAMIHASVMSRVYEAKLRLAGAREGAYPRAEDKRSIIAGSLRLIREAIDEADEWAYLIGQLSVLLRVVKIKALHLDLRLLIEASAAPGELDEGATIFQRAVKRSRRAAEALRDLSSENLGRRMFDTCCKMLGVPKPGEPGDRQLIKGLAIFPDMAPSTLFGEGWIGDLVSRQAFLDELTKKNVRDKDPEQQDDAVWTADRSNPDRKINESSLSVTGAFGETEQWLWAANRSLRKLREEIVKDATNLIPNDDGLSALLSMRYEPAHLLIKNRDEENKVEKRLRELTAFAGQVRFGARGTPAVARVPKGK